MITVYSFKVSFRDDDDTKTFWFSTKKDCNVEYKKYKKLEKEDPNGYMVFDIVKDQIVSTNQGIAKFLNVITNI